MFHINYDKDNIIIIYPLIYADLRTGVARRLLVGSGIVAVHVAAIQVCLVIDGYQRCIVCGSAIWQVHGRRRNHPQVTIGYRLDPQIFGLSVFHRVQPVCPGRLNDDLER